ncbi:CBS domain-containing protein [Cellulophaga baltica]|uniref:DUF294 nucleotidyltransferase-like domain-containing protein n=1 Tax=Cellulophaga TaxID=104264 RepID=UPI001C06D3DE|nr:MULTISPECIES: DUF294 nucleotidyltransferase-like domain-containing protein [Cellulophaga]MBU2996827.1 CBS domain-containing protein [Cellulophaga baltica]MDO6768224.1 DUF294 nucleotidyltransferase-like domain-containing protein [Cellulophaga sp. 1_MG-2023]
MKNTISHRVADFLKNFPPFNELTNAELELISEEITIIYKEKESIVFSGKEPGHSHFYVIHKGAVSLTKTESNTIVDMCDEGDIFGLRPLMANENYELEAKAHEESILYAIPFSVFKPVALSNNAIGDFLIESFASNTRNPYSKNHRGKLFVDSNINANPDTKNSVSDLKLSDLQPVRYSKKIVSCDTTTSAKKAAEIMSEKKVGAILVVHDKLPVGIITDKDLRNKIVTGEYPITASAASIMTAPIITYPTTLTITQAQMAMMKSNISHLCLTEDGTVNTKAVGILSKHDVMVALGHNPAVLIKAIKRAKKTKQIKSIRKSVMHLLKGYLDQNIPMTLISKIISELNDACIKQIIEISLSKIEEKPPVKFAWLSLGSQGRSEQMLHTDQDSALIFEDVSEEDLPKTTHYFLNLAKAITKRLNTIGYDYCPAEMMASSPQWCLSLSEWKKTTSHWIINPGIDEVLLAAIFFDYNAVYGDNTLSHKLSDHIFYTVKKYPIFFVHLAKGALQNPSPTGFFRQFLVEQDGAHKDSFDVKNRALRPLTDAARVLILSHSIKSINNTAERFEKLAELEPNNKDVYLACSYASKALLKFRTKQGLRHNDSGRFINLKTLSKEEKIKLKRTFKTVKAIQDLVTLRFQLKTI